MVSEDEPTATTEMGDEEPTIEEVLLRQQQCADEKARPQRSTVSRTGTEENESQSFLNRTRTVKKSGMSRHDAPRELSSRRPVPFGRDTCIGIKPSAKFGRTVRVFDPRFEDHCGDLRSLHVERNYDFLQEERNRRKTELEALVRRGKAGKQKKNANSETAALFEDAEKELERMAQADSRHKAELSRREIQKEVKEREKEKVRRGKKPYFMKERDLRRLELRKRFDDLKEKGSVKKYIEKKRRKLVGKQKKLLSS